MSAGRPPRVGGGGLVVLLAALIALAIPSAPAAAAGGAPEPKRESRLLFGFSDGSPIFPYDGAPSARKLAKLERRAGAEAGRFTVRWEEIQPQQPPVVGPPRYEWSKVDQLVGELRRRGIRPLPMLLGTPAWARLPNCSGICPPDAAHVADWRAFVRAIASRYRGAAAIEIWNEPNLAAYWVGEGGPDPYAYARLYGQALRATRDAAPLMPILVGGLAFAEGAALGEGSMRIVDWLEGFYATARTGAVDLADPRVGIGLHVYPGLNELAGFIEGGRVERTFEEARQAIASRDPYAAQRRLWVTEFGASTTAMSPTGARTTARQQSEAIVNSLEHMEAAPDVEAALLYTVVDRPPAGGGSEAGFGLVTRGPEFKLKPAYCAVAELYSRDVPGRCTTG